MRPNRFIWLGTKKLYDAFTFDFRKTEHGWFQAHIYKFDETLRPSSSRRRRTYSAHGLDKAGQEESIAFCEKLFAEGWRAPADTNARHLRGSAWLNFDRLICGQWSLNGRSHVVLMGDAAHTAHFAIGSGTKLALEDAIELTEQFKRRPRPTIPAVLDAYEDVRRIDVARIQNAARNAMEWFEVVGDRYGDRSSREQFMYSLLTRSQRISHENLRLRDKAWLRDTSAGSPAAPACRLDNERRRRPCSPLPAARHELANRIVVSPMADLFGGRRRARRFPHGASRLAGNGRRGARLRRMTCVSPDARITPGCLGLWNDEQAEAWKRVVDFIHGNSDAKVALQLGHAGRKGATHVPWEGADEPLERAAGR